MALIVFKTDLGMSRWAILIYKIYNNFYYIKWLKKRAAHYIKELEVNIFHARTEPVISTPLKSHPIKTTALIGLKSS